MCASRVIFDDAIGKRVMGIVIEGLIMALSAAIIVRSREGEACYDPIMKFSSTMTRFTANADLHEVLLAELARGLAHCVTQRSADR